MQAPASGVMLAVRLPWADMDGKCLETLVVGTSRMLDSNYVPCDPRF